MSLNSRHLLRRLALARPPPSRLPPTSPRPLSRLHPSSTTPTRPYPRKDSQDREPMNTDATEYSKSGSDDASAQQEEAAFDPDKTSPQEEKKEAGEGNEGNPLEV